MELRIIATRMKLLNSWEVTTFFRSVESGGRRRKTAVIVSDVMFNLQRSIVIVSNDNAAAVKGKVVGKFF